MTINLGTDPGTPLEKQKFILRELLQPLLNKLDEDAFTLGRVILANAEEQQANRFQHMCSQMNGELRPTLTANR